MAITGIKRITAQTTEEYMTTASNEERLARLESGHEYLATKADITRLESRQEGFATKEDIARLESRQDGFATKEDIARLESRQDGFATKEDLAQLETRLIKWIVGAVITAAGVAIALATLIERIT